MYAGNTLRCTKADDLHNLFIIKKYKTSIMTSNQHHAGAVAAIYRYPVKSMMGEELNSTYISQQGLLGDRAYALVDDTDGKVASAKNPRKWPNLFNFRAAYTTLLQPGMALPPVHIMLPDGMYTTSEAPGCNDLLSSAVLRKVTLQANERNNEPVAGNTENYRLADMQDNMGAETDFDLLEGTYFDGAVLHLLTTSTINRFRELYPQGRFETRRFRPNIVMDTGNEAAGFTENDWIGRTLCIGNEVQLSITRPCPRCVMTTLPQGDLPGDLGVLRTAARYNKANAGVYTAVLQGGAIYRGDRVRLE